MSTMASHEDANLIIKLYELRREDRMRAARTWFVQSFHADTLEDFRKLCPQDSAENASYRQVTTYWEMAASFLNSGVLNKELFYRSGMEMLLTYERVRMLMLEMRESRQNPNIYGELEKASVEMIEWMNSQAPHAFATFAKMVRGA